MFRFLIVSLILATVLLSAGCGKSENTDRRSDNQNIAVKESAKMDSQAAGGEEKAVIKKVIEDSIGWALKKDKELLFSTMRQDTSFFIYHPDNASTIHGFEAFRDLTENVFMNDAFKATGYEVKELRVNISKSGDVAWWSCMLDDFGEWNGKSTSWVNARWTGVMEKIDGNWMIAQMHFSFGTDAEKE